MCTAVVVIWFEQSTGFESRFEFDDVSAISSKDPTDGTGNGLAHRHLAPAARGAKGHAKIANSNTNFDAGNTI